MIKAIFSDNLTSFKHMYSNRLGYLHSNSVPSGFTYLLQGTTIFPIVVAIAHFSFCLCIGLQSFIARRLSHDENSNLADVLFIPPQSLNLVFHYARVELYPPALLKNTLLFYPFPEGFAGEVFSSLRDV